MTLTTLIPLVDVGTIIWNTLEIEFTPSIAPDLDNNQAGPVGDNVDTYLLQRKSCVCL